VFPIQRPASYFPRPVSRFLNPAVSRKASSSMSKIFLEPGALVRLESEPEWGIGQIQSIAGTRVTVNFENAGKKVINVAQAELVAVTKDELKHGDA
jgi:hypothetical protein